GLNRPLAIGGLGQLAAGVGGDQVGEVGLMVAPTLVVPEHVLAERRAALAALGGVAGARDLAVDDALEDRLAVVRVYGDVHALRGVLLDAAADAVLGLVAARGQQQRHEQQ